MSEAFKDLISGTTLTDPLEYVYVLSSPENRAHLIFSTLELAKKETIRIAQDNNFEGPWTWKFGEIRDEPGQLYSNDSWTGLSLRARVLF